MIRKKASKLLSILAIFKNEAHIIDEWISHYINEGVEHFYLVNNGSTDNFLPKLQPFITKGIVTLIEDDKRWAQVELYNRYFEEFRKESEWFIICDLDEFMYARRKYSTIAAFLKSLHRKVGIVQVPWKMFGSSGHIEQPSNMVASFTKRCHYDGEKKETMFDDQRIFCKSIIRSRFVRKLHVHFADIGDSRVLTADKERIKKPVEFLPISEQILEESHVHVNHYPIQSLNWFMNVKMTRGDVHRQQQDHFRDMDYFRKYDSDSNEILDEELAEK